MGIVGSTLVIFIVILRMAVLSRLIQSFLPEFELLMSNRCWNAIHHLSIWGSLIAYILMLLIYSAFYDIDPSSLYYVTCILLVLLSFSFLTHNDYLLRSASFYFGIIIMSVIAMLPFFTFN